MSTPNPVPATPAPAKPSFWHTLVTIMEHDSALTVVPPLVTFLNTVQTVKGDPVKLAAGLAQLQGNLVVSIPALAGSLEADVAAIISGKLQQAAASVPAS